MRGLKTILLFLILVGVYWILFVPGPRAAGDFPYAYPDSVRAGLNLPQTWSSRGVGMGEYGVSTLWAWPIDFLYGLGSTVGIDFSLLERIFGIIPILLLGMFGIRKLFTHFKIEGWGSWVATLFYLTNTYIILLIDGGQFAIGLAYAWLPAAYVAFENAVVGGLKKKVIAALAVSLLGFFDIRFIYVLALLLFVRFFVEFLFLKPKNWVSWVLSWFKTGFVVGVVMIGLNAYWILPSILAKAPSLPATYARSSQASFLSFANLGHSIFVLQPHWYKNVFGKVILLRPEFILIPILVFLAPVLRKKDKRVGFWLLTALMAVFLVKGSNPPLGDVYTWLFTHIPGFSLFRDPTKFFFLTALSYSVLVGITINALRARIKTKILPVVLTFYFIILAWPAYSGKMTGTLSNPPYQAEYSRVAQILESDKNFGRILWIPSRAPLGFVSSDHSPLDASRILYKRPFASAVTGTYELFNFLRKPWIGQLLDVTGIKYIIYPYPDTRREVLKQDNIDYYHWFLGKLADSSWGRMAGDLGGKDSPVPVIEVNKHEDRFFISPNFWWIIGSDRIYEDFAKLPDFDLSKNALVFAEEHPGLSQRLKEFPNARLLIYGKKDTDLAANFLDTNALIFPAKSLDFSPNESGWWKRETVDLISWRGFLQEKYAIDNKDFDLGGGWAVGEGNVKLQISNDKLKKGNILLARVMESTKGGKIEFYQGSNLVGVVSTKLEPAQYDNANVRWFEVGNLNSEAPVEIKTYGDINVVNALASVPVSEWSHINESIHRYKKVEWDKLTDKEKKSLFKSAGVPTVNYQRVNSTHYKAEVEGIIGSATLVFSETYDPLWEANGKTPVKLYSLINGFSIDKDGTYDVYFTPQKYVLPGLVVSGLSLLSLIGLAVFAKK